MFYRKVLKICNIQINYFTFIYSIVRKQTFLRADQVNGDYSYHRKPNFILLSFKESIKHFFESFFIFSDKNEEKQLHVPKSWSKYTTIKDLIDKNAFSVMLKIVKLA